MVIDGARQSNMFKIDEVVLQIGLLETYIKRNVRPTHWKSMSWSYILVIWKDKCQTNLLEIEGLYLHIRDLEREMSDQLIGNRRFVPTYKRFGKRNVRPTYWKLKICTYI